MTVPNILRKVEGYLTGEGFPQLMLGLDILDCMDTRYESWRNLAGTRGSTVAFQLPARFRTTNSFGLGAGATSRNFVERQIALAVDQIVHTDYILDDEELATYDLSGDGSLGVSASAAIAEMATTVNQDVTNKMALGGYRFLGNASKLTVDAVNGEIPLNINTTYTDLVKNINQFFNFGGKGTLHCVLPSSVIPLISASGLQQFAPFRNNKLARNWQIGTLPALRGDVRFYSSDLIQPFEAGTAALAQTTPYTIQSFTQTTYQQPGTNTILDTTSINVNVTTANTTAKIGDLIDIVPFDDTQPDIRMLQFIGHGVAQFNPQARVVNTSVVSPTEIVIQVYPALVFNTPGNETPDDNLSRALQTEVANPGAADRVRFVKSRIPGFIMLDKYGKFAAPRLADTAPYTSAVVSENGVSMRAYRGYIPETGGKAFVQEMLYGSLAVPEGIAEIPFSLQLGNQY